MTCRVLLSAALAIVLGGSVATESAAQRRQEGMVRIQMSVQMFVAGPTDDSEEAERHRERARRAIYGLAAKECDVMREVIAQDCRLDSVNVNLNRQSNQQMQGYQVGGSMTYQITIK